MTRAKKLIITVILLVCLPVFLAKLSPERQGRLKLALVGFLKTPLKITTKTTHKIKDFLSLPAVFRQNRCLKDELSCLKSDRVALEEMRQENNRLRELISFKKSIILKTVAVQVIGEDSSGLNRSILINKGSADGLNKDDAVLAKEGLVGKVLEVSPHSARIMCITDLNSAVSALIQRTREAGLVCATGDGRCRINYISKKEDIEVNDVVITSGQSMIYPQDIEIGRVVKIALEDNKISWYGVIEPSVEFSKLEEVLVVVK